MEQTTVMIVLPNLQQHMQKLKLTQQVLFLLKLLLSLLILGVQLIVHSHVQCLIMTQLIHYAQPHQ